MSRNNADHYQVSDAQAPPRCQLRALLFFLVSIERSGDEHPLSGRQDTPSNAETPILGADMTLSPSWSFCIDIGGTHAGAVSGTMNMAGNLGAAITALVSFYQPSTSKGSAAFFQAAAALSAIAVICWIFANRNKTITQS